jgi:hypothetical protein
LSLAKTVFYAKNLASWERAVRLVLSAAVVGGAFVTLASPTSWIVATSALGFAATGLIGFCPVCAVAGRRLGKR